MTRILEKNGIDNTNIDGASFNNFCAGQRSGIIKSTLNECAITTPSSSVINIETGELLVSGVRVVLNNPTNFTFSTFPSSATRYSLIAEIVIDSNSDITSRVFVQLANSALVQNDLFKTETGAGTYQIELARFTLTPNGIEDLVRTVDIITGGMGGDGAHWEVGEITTEKLAPDLNAEVDIDYNEDTKKYDFNFALPEANNIVSVLKTSTTGLIDTYTITFMNGETKTFDVTNGKSIVSILKTATVGNVDTYTITYNDSTTSTFTVSNSPIQTVNGKNDVNVVLKTDDISDADQTNKFITAEELAQIATNNNNINALETNKADKATTLEGYGITDGLKSSLKGSVNGLAELDENGKVLSTQLPSYVDDVLEFANYASLPTTGEGGKIYVALDTNLTYRWGGTAYVEISPSLALGETSSTAFRGDWGKTAYDHSQLASGNPHNVSKNDLELENVDNTSDANKPVSTAQATALGLKVDKVLGKELSTNDYDNTEKQNVADNTSARHTHLNKAILDSTTASYTIEEQTKLTGIQEGAEVNVQSDWNATSGDALILNKPTTISRYGITDAYTKTEIDSKLNILKDPDKTYLVVRIPIDNNEFTLLTGTDGSPNYTIEWGDGSSEDVVGTSNPTHTYSKAGMYLITISGDFANGIVVGSSTNVNKAKMIEVYGGTNYPTSIEAFAFQNCSNLTTATFPNATSIGSEAFRDCSNLTTATFPKVTTIGISVFESCSNLTTANFPNATSIEDFAFFKCSNLTTATFPNATSIGSYAFDSCINLKTLTLGNVETTATGTRFYNVKLDTLTISGTITDTDIVRIKNLIISNGGSFSQSCEIKYGLQVEKTPTLDNDVVNKIYLDTNIVNSLNNKADKSTTISGYGITDAYTKTEIESKIASVYKYKGSVANFASLPTSGLTIGDVYNVEDTGDNYAWTGTVWDKLAGTIDLSNYATKLSIGQWHVPYRDISGTGEANTSKLATMTSPLPQAIIIRDAEGKATFVGGTSANQGIVKSQLDSAVASCASLSGANTFSGINTFSNNIIGNLTGNASTSTYCSRLKGTDTRNDNQTPEWYYIGQSINSRTFLSEFKNASVLGLSGSDYCLLLTVVPWSDSTGGLPSQTAYMSNGKKYARYATSTTTWSAWEKEATLSDIPTFTLSGSTLTITTV